MEIFEPQMKLERRAFVSSKKFKMKNKKNVQFAPKKYRMVKQIQNPCNKNIKALPKKVIGTLNKHQVVQKQKAGGCKSGQKKLKLVTVTDKKIFKIQKRAKRPDESKEPQPKIVGIGGTKIFKFQDMETKEFTTISRHSYLNLQKMAHSIKTVVVNAKQVYITARIQRLQKYRQIKLNFSKGKKIVKPALKATAAPTKQQAKLVNSMPLTRTVEKPITGAENVVKEILPIDEVALDREGNLVVGIVGTFIIATLLLMVFAVIKKIICVCTARPQKDCEVSMIIEDLTAELSVGPLESIENI